jgi:hypothetical protein
MKRTLVLASIWVVAAAAAVGLGFLAVSLVGASTSAATSPAAATSAATSSALPGTEATAPAPPVPTGEYATVGGTAYARCSGTALEQLGGVPAAGWELDDSNTLGRVEFRNGSQKVEVHADCATGTPTFTDEGIRADNSGGGSDDSSGSDDRGGDDSGGSGGHGSDD